MQSELRKARRRFHNSQSRGLFINDDELIKLLGYPPDQGLAIIRYLDLNWKATGFPQKQKNLQNKRYRPAVERWLRRPPALLIETVRDP